MSDTVVVNIVWSHHKCLILVSIFLTIGRNHFSSAQFFPQYFSNTFNREINFLSEAEMDCETLKYLPSCHACLSGSPFSILVSWLISITNCSYIIKSVLDQYWLVGNCSQLKFLHLTESHMEQRDEPREDSQHVWYIRNACSGIPQNFCKRTSLVHEHGTPGHMLKDSETLELVPFIVFLKTKVMSSMLSIHVMLCGVRAAWHSRYYNLTI